jgi:hypothetical protein
VITPLPTSRRREAGAVNATWLIVIMILWLGTLYLLYAANDSIAGADQRAAAAIAERADWEGRWDGMNADFVELSNSVGYTDGAVGSKSDIVSVKGDLANVTTALGDVVGSTEVTLDDAVKKLLADRQASISALNLAKADFARERDARSAAEQKTASIESTYKSQVDSLNQQLADAQDAGDRQAANDQGRIDDITDENTSLDADKRSAERTLADTEDSARKAASLAAAQIRALAPKRAPMAPEEPDGELIEVSQNGQVAWIDLGGANGLTAGTRFELLRRGKAGMLESRGQVEVREVKSNSAMVGLVGEADVRDPMLPGDLVRNPHFHKHRVLHFVLLGDFPLTMSKEFASQRLHELGAVVDDMVGTSTDVLVLGEKSLAGGEDAAELTETEAFKTAEKFGIRIILLPELASYLRY